MKNQKFENISNNYVNGNIADFKKQLKTLSKKDLVYFLQWCKEYCEDLDIYEIYKYF